VPCTLCFSLQGLQVWQQIRDHCQQGGWCDFFLPRIMELQAQVASKDEQLQQQHEQLAAKDALLAEKEAEAAMLRTYIAGLPDA
jgi:hypothetical protein